MTLTDSGQHLKKAGGLSDLPGQASARSLVYLIAAAREASGISFSRCIWTSFLLTSPSGFFTGSARKICGQGIRDARVSKTHVFFKELFDQNKLLGLITQNIDGLHEKSGLPGHVLVNIHGTNLEVICLKCNDITPAYETLDELNLDNGAPLCSKCGGLLKPNTISFGQNLVPEDLERAQGLALSCDMMIAAGSTLVVQPAAAFPILAKQNGALLAIITQSDTPLDDSADFVFHEKLGDFIDRLNF